MTTRILLCLAFIFTTVLHAEAAVITLTVVEDAATLSGDGTNWNHGSFGLASETTTTTDLYWGSWLKFDLSSLAGLQINSATLQLTTHYNHNDTAINHEVFSSSDDSWSQTTITGLSRPGESTLSSLDVESIPNVNATYSWDVLSGVIGADGLTGANSELTLFIRPEDVSPNILRGPHFYATENGNELNFPVIVLDVEPIPEPSTIAIWSLIGFIGIGGAARRRRKEL